jgi:hypothetical protein
MIITAQEQTLAYFVDLFDRQSTPYSTIQTDGVFNASRRKETMSGLPKHACGNCGIQRI